MYPELFVVSADPVLRECAASASSALAFRVHTFASIQDAMRLQGGRTTHSPTPAQQAATILVIDSQSEDGEQARREACVSFPHARLVFLQGTGSGYDRQSTFGHQTPTMAHSVSGQPSGFLIARPSNVREMQRLLERLGMQSARASEQSCDEIGLETLVGRSVAFRVAVDIAMRAAADADGPVLVTGEKGAGRRLFARAIHAESPRATRPFIEFDCRTLPAGFFENGLCSAQEKPADRPAVWTKLQASDGGTLILHQVTALPRQAQLKLLSYLDAHKLWRIQQLCRPRHDLRVIATSDRTIERDVRAGEFSGELFDRLCAHRLELPSLREHPGDTLLLADHFLARNAGGGNTAPALTSRAKELLVSYPWPENISELQRVLLRAWFEQDVEQRIDAEHLMPYLVAGRRARSGEHRAAASAVTTHQLQGGMTPAATQPAMQPPKGEEERMQAMTTSVQASAENGVIVQLPDGGVSFDDIEKAVLVAALQQNHGNVVRTARFLHMGRGSLRYRLEKFRLVEPRRRAVTPRTELVTEGLRRAS